MAMVVVVRVVAVMVVAAMGMAATGERVTRVVAMGGWARAAVEMAGGGW